MNCVKPVSLSRGVKGLDGIIYPRHSVVSCGKCLACLSRKRSEWAFRLQQEWKASTSSLFVTLTYDRKNLKEADYGLQKRDLQLFFKRLRKADQKAKVRYFAVGEYGSRTYRPHYHILLFNSNEALVRKAWQKGIVHIGYCTEASVSYCLKYMVQPDVFVRGKQKPFRLMSRAYGIGAQYLTESMVAWHRDGAKGYAMVNDQKVALPRYYKDIIWYGSQRKKVSDIWKWTAVKKSRVMLRKFIKTYGLKNAKEKIRARRHAHLSRIKVKVAYTQKF